MDMFRIQGPTSLVGRVRASGAKNAALPALAACLLASEPVVLRHVPEVRDLRTMRKLLEHLGVESEDLGDGAVRFEATGTPPDDEAPYELVKTMRASVLSLGPLLARRGHARVSLPGGCAIGVRPIDQHLAGLAALGAEIRLESGYVEARARRLRGGRYRFDMPTVTGTENLLMAAALADGTTVLDNCAREPEIADLARLLQALGAVIDGAGTERITIEGRRELGGGEHRVIADRIEGGTYLVGAALTGGDVTLEGAVPGHLKPLLDVLEEAGARVDVEPSDAAGDCGEGTIRVRSEGALSAVDVETSPHPGFPTDLQAQLMALMTRAEGTTTIRETVFENRFQHVPELMRMGAVIDVKGNLAHVFGPTPLSGSPVMATDLRASACLVLAGLAASGETTVQRIYHLDRGYERMEEKLQRLGAHLERVSA